MSDIQELIKTLQSSNPNIRYEACEKLRVKPELPHEAVEALRLSLNDENMDVADAAKRAIELHTHTTRPYEEKENIIAGDKEEAQKTSRKPLGIASLLTLIVGGGLFISGLLLYMTSMASRTEESWVDPAGFGEFFGLIALVSGLIILGLWYLFHRLN